MLVFAENVGRDTTEGLSSPAHVARRPITGASELTVWARGGFWSPAAGSVETYLSGQEVERCPVSLHLQQVGLLPDTMTCIFLPQMSKTAGDGDKGQSVVHNIKVPSPLPFVRSST